MEQDDRETSYGNWDLVTRLLRFSWRYRGDCLKVLFLQLAVLGFTLSGLRLAGLGVDVIHRFADASVPEPRWPFGFQPPADWTAAYTIGVVAMGIVLFALSKALVNYIYTMSVARLVQAKIVPDLRSEVYEKLQKLSFRFFDANASGSIINRLTSDVQAVRIFVDGVLLQVFVMLLSLAVYITFMVNIHPLLTLACLASTPLLWVASVIFSKHARPAFVHNRHLIDKMVLTLSESVQGIFAVKGFGREKEENEKFERSSVAVKDHMGRVFWMVSVFAPTVNLITQINIAILLGYGGYLVYQKELALGSGIIVFSGLLQQFSNQVANISGLANRVQRSLTGARRVFEIMDTNVDIRSKKNAHILQKARGEVEFRKVSFAYREGNSVLEDVSFVVHPGKRVAIVGATGAGKSALLSLIPRFYDPDDGKVLIDGIDARDLDVDALRRNIGIVFQESFMFSNTIAANIAFGNPLASREQVVRAAKVAAAHDFILEMPNGYDEVLGESGVNLSGGQRQRLAIARAVLLDPAILILDDPTAAIDSETEDEILRAMDRAMQGRTTFTVAHRMSTLRRADQIIVLSGGRIVQTGTHAELLKSPGLYRNLAQLQVVDDLGSRERILKDAERKT